MKIKVIMTFADVSTENCSSPMVAHVKNGVAKRCNGCKAAHYRNGCQLLVPDPKNQQILQKVGGMMDQKMYAFSKLLGTLSGMEIYSYKLTTKAISDVDMPNFHVKMVGIEVH